MTNAKQLTDQFWNLFETGRLDELTKLIDADCHFKMPGMDLRGAPALVQMLQAYRTAFPDMKHTVLHHVEAGDTIALELKVEGTHLGPMQLAAGAVPATGKKVVWESCDYIRVANGKVRSWHVYHDSLPFMAALGLVPPAASS